MAGFLEIVGDQLLGGWVGFWRQDGKNTVLSEAECDKRLGVGKWIWEIEDDSLAGAEGMYVEANSGR